jgi:GYF domain 2
MDPSLEGQEWLVLIDQDNRSRMSTREVLDSVRAGRLAPDTLVWRGGMSAWASIGSLAELATQNSIPMPPRGQPRSGYNPRFAETVISSHRAARQYQRRPTASNPRLVLALIAAGTAVLLTVLATSYALYTGGAFQAGSGRPDAEAHPASRFAD